MSKQKIREWLKERYPDMVRRNENVEFVSDIIHKYPQEQRGWNQERMTLLQAVRFYAEQASYNPSWKSGDPFHVMEDRGEVARNAILKVNLPPTEEA